MSSLVINVGAQVTTARGQSLTITIVSNGRFGVREVGGRAHFWNASGTATSERTLNAYGHIVASVPAAADEAATVAAPRPAYRQLPAVDIDGIIGKMAAACASANKFKAKGYQLVHALLAGRETVNAFDVWAMSELSLDEKKWILQSTHGTRFLPETFRLTSWDNFVRDLALWQDATTLVITQGHYYRCSDGKIIFMKTQRSAQVLLGTDTLQYNLSIEHDGSIGSRSFRVTEDLGTSYREARPQNGQIYKYITGGHIRVIMGDYLVDPTNGCRDAWNTHLIHYDFVGNLPSFGILKEQLAK
jgi:hypothetical protein